MVFGQVQMPVVTGVLGLNMLRYLNKLNGFLMQSRCEEKVE